MKNNLSANDWFHKIATAEYLPPKTTMALYQKAVTEAEPIAMKN